SWIPNPLFPIYVANIHRCKHGSDSGVYDDEGRFIPQKFEEIFSKFDKESNGSLSLKELWDMTQEIRNVMDPFGWFANKFEWGTLYLLMQKGGRVEKEDIRRCFDGTLFYHMEKRVKQAKQERLESRRQKNVKKGN
ncbi:hypothetical protein HK101_007122, partial [Irineochytrium annulatum]